MYIRSICGISQLITFENCHSSFAESVSWQQMKRMQWMEINLLRCVKIINLHSLSCSPHHWNVHIVPIYIECCCQCHNFLYSISLSVFFFLIKILNMFFLWNGKTWWRQMDVHKFAKENSLIYWCQRGIRLQLIKVWKCSMTNGIVSWWLCGIWILNVLLCAFSYFD